MKWKILTATTLMCGSAGLALAAAPPMTTSPTPYQTHSMNQGRYSHDSMQQSAGHTVTVNGTKIFYRESGHGEPLLLIHGYPLDDQLFMHQREHLASHFKVITPDLPGFGQSGTFKHGHASLKAYAKAMFGLMNKLNINKAIIGGHSMGGMTVVEMYKMHPEHFKAMILIDTAAAAAPIPNKMEWKGFKKLTRKKSDYKKTTIMLLAPKMLTGHTRMHDKQLLSEYKSMIEAASKKGIAGGGMALADRPDNSSVLKKVDVPTLILVGSEDPLTPFEIAKKMHNKVKNSTLDIVQGGSHAEIFAKSKKADHDIMQWAQSNDLMSNNNNAGMRH